jgi:hypothetical protein
MGPARFVSRLSCLARVTGQVGWSGYEGNSGVHVVQANTTNPSKIQHIGASELGRFGSCCTAFSHRKAIELMSGSSAIPERIVSKPSILVCDLGRRASLVDVEPGNRTLLCNHVLLAGIHFSDYQVTPSSGIALRLL